MERNNLLQRAIRLYIGSKSAMKARRMEVALIPAKRAALANGRDSDRDLVERLAKLAKLANLKFLQIFGGLVLGCIKTKFCKKICV